MRIKLNCVCGRVLVVSQRRAGTAVVCPKCGQSMMAPGDAAEPAPPPIQSPSARVLNAAGEPTPPPIQVAPPARTDVPVVAAGKTTSRAAADAEAARELSAKRLAEKKSHRPGPGHATEREALASERVAEPSDAGPAENPASTRSTSDRDRGGAASGLSSSAAVEFSQVTGGEQSVAGKSGDHPRPAPASDDRQPVGGTERPAEEKQPAAVTAALEGGKITDDEPPAAAGPSPGQGLEANFPAPRRDGVVVISASSNAADDLPHEAEDDSLAAPPVQDDQLSQLPGSEHDQTRVFAVYYLAAAIVLNTLFGATPAVLQMVNAFRDLDRGLAVWTIVMLFASGLQLAYAIYLFQLPDWSTVRVVAVAQLMTATGYAILLGVAVMAGADNAVLRFLEVTHYQRTGKTAGWCFIMLCLTSLLAYFCGRIGARWRADERPLDSAAG